MHSALAITRFGIYPQPTENGRLRSLLIASGCIVRFENIGPWQWCRGGIAKNPLVISQRTKNLKLLFWARMWMLPDMLEDRYDGLHDNPLHLGQ